MDGPEKAKGPRKRASRKVPTYSDTLRDAIATRVERGLSQADVARISGLTLEEVQNIEQKGPGVCLSEFAIYLSGWHKEIHIANSAALDEIEWA